MTDVKPSRVQRAIAKTEKPVTDLVLDGIRIRTLSVEDGQALAAVADSVEFLGLNETKLVSFDNLPIFTACEALEFHDNPTLPSELAKIPTHFPALRELSLCGCTHLSSLQDLEFIVRTDDSSPQGFLPELRVLDLEPTTLTESLPNYRSEIFDRVPNLELIDRLNRAGDEVASDDDEQAQEWIHEFYDSLQTGQPIGDDDGDYEPN